MGGLLRLSCRRLGRLGARGGGGRGGRERKGERGMGERACVKLGEANERGACVELVVLEALSAALLPPL